MKKRILALAPVMPQESDIEGIAATVSFLNNEYQIDFIDPLSIGDELSNKAYYQLWKDELSKRLTAYNAFLGFSFGGVILQQCFSLFDSVKKPIVLFSTPTFADEELQKKLGGTIRLCKENRVIEALNYLYCEVFYPNKPPQEALETNNETLAAKRLIAGLQRVLDTDSRTILQESTVEYLHLIGQYSHLVNADNVLSSKFGRLEPVPAAGMRVLQDNQAFCKKMILERLNSEA